MLFPTQLGSFAGWPTGVNPPLLSTIFPGNQSLLSPSYRILANCSCFILLRQEMPCALILALAKAGNNMAASIAIMAMTTSSSMRVKPRSGRDWLDFFLLVVFMFHFNSSCGGGGPYRAASADQTSSGIFCGRPIKDGAGGRTPSDWPD